ncbi:hypothetical protein NLO413_1034 [Candidatus Neoehrlichia lotoris str. RAC413]|uniref:Uncharacterized protein n=1 Tax=Candidatus Neoehrlichia procyonis str. RAC413 TaxID=1359163 RepID=A0A0F3NRY1_9RICK|nr:hypothetical protein NLO413_1034 [Candidatus Neoehrlichia lotoris str. RAC413]
MLFKALYNIYAVTNPKKLYANSNFYNILHTYLSTIQYLCNA